MARVTDGVLFSCHEDIIDGFCTVPNDVREIHLLAFAYCARLTSITLPCSLREIGMEAFYRCRALSSITLPLRLREIGNGAFKGCSSLPSVTMPPAIRSVGTQAFADCTNLVSVTIPGGAVTISAWAFTNCTRLTNVTIAGSVIGISASAFDLCTSLNRFNIDKRHINELDRNGKTLLQRVISSTLTPENVIEALILAGADIANVQIPATRAPGLGARMIAWRREYELREYRAQIQPLFNDIAACKAGFGPLSPITALPLELLTHSFFSLKCLQDEYKYTRQKDLDQLKTDVFRAASLDNRMTVEPKVLARLERLDTMRNLFLTGREENPELVFLVNSGRMKAFEAWKETHNQEFKAWKDKGGSTAMLPHSPPKP